ncbi:MAG: hypothetical protein U9R38_00990 [Candidatus Margulisiibacteriota bacterium]|nr:hypothetical protein [Candidatus Margulisiibacteriota bacterium]
MIKKILLAFVIFNLAFVITATAVEVGGYYENNLVGIVKRTGGGMVGDLNKLRLKIDAQPRENILFHFEPEYDTLVKSGPLPLISDVSGIDQLNWDRAYVKLYYPQVDITLGKQRIAWGTGYIWNPTDVLNPFTLSFAVSEEDEEDEIAARFEIPLGEASHIDAFAIAGKEWKSTTKAIRYKTNIDDYDVSANYVDQGDAGFQFGIDGAGELFDLGIRKEIALVSSAETNRYFKFVFGVDYTFENGWYINSEYFFNGLGKKKKADYDWASYLAGDIQQLGMDYFYLGFQKALDELTTINLSILMNADDMSHLVYPSFSYNMWQDVDVSLEALFYGGESGSEYMPTDQDDSSGFIGSKIVFVKMRHNF